MVTLTHSLIISYQYKRLEYLALSGIKLKRSSYSGLQAYLPENGGWVSYSKAYEELLKPRQVASNKVYLVEGQKEVKVEEYKTGSWKNESSS